MACHRDGDWVTVWVICSRIPFALAAITIYALESDLVLAFPHVHISLQVISRYGADVAALADIPAGSPDAFHGLRNRMPQAVETSPRLLRTPLSCRRPSHRQTTPGGVSLSASMPRSITSTLI